MSRFQCSTLLIITPLYHPSRLSALPSGEDLVVDAAALSHLQLALPLIEALLAFAELLEPPHHVFDDPCLVPKLPLGLEDGTVERNREGKGTATGSKHVATPFPNGMEAPINRL